MCEAAGANYSRAYTFGGYMKLIVCSTPDRASVNIRDHLLQMEKWRVEGEFEGRPCYWYRDMCLIEIGELHIFSNDIDSRFRRETGHVPESVIFLSRHRAASGIRSLTIHPIGNFSDADFGGKPGHLVPASPHLMTSILRKLYVTASNLPFEISFEVTHHGPYLETPSLFVEIGSDENMWDHEGAGRAIASAILGSEEEEYPVVVGIGGGHYAPRFTEIALKKKVSFGHMVPNYALKGEEGDRSAIERALEASDTGKVYIHKKSMKKSALSKLYSLLEETGAEVVSGKDLEDLSELSE